MKISIIIPAYKSLYLHSAIESVLSQTYTDWELVVVDDCSPENIKDVVMSFHDPRIRYHRHSHNYGASNLVANWNKCIEYCTGEYVLCMGDDDMLPTGSLTEYMKVINKYPNIDVIHGWTNIINSDSQVIDILQQHPSHESVMGVMLRCWKGDDIFAGDILYKTETLRNKGGFVNMPMAWHSDHLTAFLCGKEWGIASTSGLAFSYRRHSNTISMSTECMEKKLKADFNTYDWLVKFCDDYVATSEEDKMQNDAVKRFLPHIFELSLCRTISESNRKRPIQAYFAFMRLPRKQRTMKLFARIMTHIFA